MQVQYIKEYSNCLDREMEYKIYGQGGKLCLAIPSHVNFCKKYERENERS